MLQIPSAEEIRDAVDRGIRTGLRAALAPISAEVDTVRRGMRPVLTVHEVADMLGCTPDRVMRHHVRKCGLAAYRPAKQATFLPADVEAYVRRFPDVAAAEWAVGAGSGSDAERLAALLGLTAYRAEMVVALVRAVALSDGIAAVEPAVYTVDDVVARVPWGRSTVDKMVKRRQIPMVYTEGRWIITPAAFRAAAERGFAVPGGRVQTRR